MSDFPSLAEIHARHAWRYAPDRVCDCGWCGTIHDPERDLRQQHAEHVADVWRDACTITTADQLDSPELSGWGTLICEIHTPDDDCPESNCWIVPVVWEMVNQMGFMCHNPRHLDESPRLPALLIWHPEWTA